jgi:GMP synthase-like glutamine amidotransferase
LPLNLDCFWRDIGSTRNFRYFGWSDKFDNKYGHNTGSSSSNYNDSRRESITINTRSYNGDRRILGQCYGKVATSKSAGTIVNETSEVLGNATAETEKFFSPDKSQ